MSTKKPYKSRYYLHQRTKEAFKYSSQQKTVFVPYTKENEALQNKHIGVLQNQFQYNIQLEIE